MARYQAEEQHRVMLYDFVECQKRMSVSNYVKNDSLRHMDKLNESVYSLRDETFECKVKKYKVRARQLKINEILRKFVPHAAHILQNETKVRIQIKYSFSHLPYLADSESGRLILPFKSVTVE